MITVQDLFEIGMSRTVPHIADYTRGAIINLGAGKKKLPFPTIDLDLPAWDAYVDEIPFADGSIDHVIALHFLEHLTADGVVKVLQECDRVLRPGGTVNIVVPYYNSQIQAQNLDHYSVFCEETWRNLFSDPTYDRPGVVPWTLRVGFNMICGIVERNLCLMTQLVKE